MKSLTLQQIFELDDVKAFAANLKKGSVNLSDNLLDAYGPDIACFAAIKCLKLLIDNNYRASDIYSLFHHTGFKLNYSSSVKNIKQNVFEMLDILLKTHSIDLNKNYNNAPPIVLALSMPQLVELYLKHGASLDIHIPKDLEISGFRNNGKRREKMSIDEICKFYIKSETRLKKNYEESLSILQRHEKILNEKTTFTDLIVSKSLVRSHSAIKI